MAVVAVLMIAKPVLLNDRPAEAFHMYIKLFRTLASNFEESALLFHAPLVHFFSSCNIVELFVCQFRRILCQEFGHCFTVGDVLVLKEVAEEGS